MIKILANDGLEIAAINKLKSMGMEVETNHFNKDELCKVLKDYNVLVVRSATKVTAEVLESAKDSNLKLVIRAGVGIDNIDVKYADKVNIEVRNTPNASSNSVAELSLGHMIAVSRYIGSSNVTMRNGQWNKKKYQGTELLGKTLGIIGMGRIGRSLAEKATALGMKVIYTDLFGIQENLAYEFYDLNGVLEKADYISLHVPYDKKAGSLITAKEIEKMKDGAVIINCARGKVVDEKSLLDALNSGKLAGAGIDVFEEEPTKNEALITHPNVSVTPHIGAATAEAQNRIGEEVVFTIEEFFK